MQDVATPGPLALIAELEQNFVDKREAIARLDAGQLERLGAREDAVVRDLGRALQAKIERPAEVDLAMRRLRWQAEAFRVLVDDVLAHVGARLGAPGPTGTYDRRSMRRYHRNQAAHAG